MSGRCDMPEFVSKTDKPQWLLTLKDWRLDAFVLGYTEAAEWLLSDCDPETGGTDHKGRSDKARYDRAKSPRWGRKALREIVQNCRGFLNQEAEASDPRSVRGLLMDLGDYSDMYSRAGMDYYLSRNRHGAGYWDSPEAYGGGEVARRLHDLAKQQGSHDVTIWRGVLS